MLGIVVPFALAVLAAVVMGLINGVMVSIGRVPAFIMTFGMMNMARGCAYIISNSNTISVFPDVIRLLAMARSAA
jgi:ribose transport system permease protein